MVQLVYSAKEIIEDTIADYQERQRIKEELIEKYGDTPVTEIPIQDLVIVAGDVGINDLPESIRSDVMNYMVQQKAEELGPLEDYEISQEEKEYLASPTAFSNLMGLDGPMSRAEVEGVKEGLRTNVTGFLARKTGITDDLTISEEFDRRVKVARMEMAEGGQVDYTAGMVKGGALFDPMGMAVGGIAPAKLAATGAQVLSKAPATGAVLGAGVGGAVEGAGYGAMLPVYPEFGDSRAKQAAIGAGIGGAITAVPAAGVSMLTRTPVPQPKPELAFPPVALQPRALASEGFTPRPQQFAQPTPVTTASVDPVPQVTPFAPTTLKVQKLDKQIENLKVQAEGKGRKKSKPIKAQINKLEKTRQQVINEANQRSKDVEEQVIGLENQLARLAKRKDELQPGRAGEQARRERASRRQAELQEEKNKLLGLDFATNGGYTVKMTNVDYDNPAKIAAARNRLELNNPTNSEVKMVLEPPQPTGDPVTDAANKINYLMNSDDAGPRMGLDAPRSASSAGVRPSLQYADEVSAGMDPLRAEQAGTVSGTTARRAVDNKLSPGRDTGRQPDMTKEELGRRAILLEASKEQKKIQQAQQMGMRDEDIEWAVENIPTISNRRQSYESLEAAAARLKAGPIGRDYDTMVDFLMDQKNRILSPEEMEALRPLFIEANNRVDKILRQMNKLSRDGDADSVEMVKLIEELYFNNYIAELQKTNGRAASHILSQAKKSKQFVAENTRRVNENQLITNLFGVECG